MAVVIMSRATKGTVTELIVPIIGVRSNSKGISRQVESQRQLRSPPQRAVINPTVTVPLTSGCSYVSEGFFKEGH